MMKRLGKQPLFLWGFGFIIVMLAGSLIHANFFDSYVRHTPFLENGQGEMVGPPFAPFEHSILGTDMNGNHIVYYILKGAKYTILGVFSIGALSFALAFLFGIPLGFKNKGKSKIVENTLSALYFIPASVIAYNFLRPLLLEPMSGFPTTLGFRLGTEVLVIGILLTPPAAIYIANETSAILKKEYITTSRSLGAGPFHLFRSHLLPHLKERLVTLFMRQNVQAVLVISHLGVFELFFGGTKAEFGLGAGRPVPVTYEWASMVGMYFRTLQTNVYWLVGIPLIFLVLFVLALTGMSRALRKVLAEDGKVSKSEEESDLQSVGGRDDFSMVEKASKY
ncbi:ABC transporter permease subunit [Salimicrobium salexigens]|uniref:Peptide/nickel transport system permease protein n=1 Tax=Salimicrobium salexigens TaxID=908941 RepID=A0ABY1KSJ3_9BACI|nr:ABC transporter permease subunit [Salimicrobium salexigens]SIS71814.1 peptide/nickel transport system permease protein [Salimicrobium salexigens]